MTQQELDHMAESKYPNAKNGAPIETAFRVMAERAAYIEGIKLMEERVRELEGALERVVKECDDSGLKNCSIDNKLHMAIYHSRHAAKTALSNQPTPGAKEGV
jgi:hypothetical protein